MMYRKFNVTQEQIDNSKVKHSGRCMIADALQSHIPWATHIAVDLQTIRFSDPKKGKRIFYATPPGAVIALFNFDEGGEVKPFSVSLSRGWSLPMRSRRPNYKPKTTTPKKKASAAKKASRKDYVMPSRFREYGLRSLAGLREAVQKTTKRK